ncbi:MAG: tetratricopeptide repeat protein [Paludisphaera borealis]|uniref:tetratricopeptide repeat protein n=1 Tax=Paludisphaera borealis TaxID=1387353 RepID=UPI00283C5DC4|nr:tetratricopeptide repeat protein [Paludisphaera borealis]MDR3622644.1 tetratricopeptide repeat protein [Paludisphaera borealis]
MGPKTVKRLAIVAVVLVLATVSVVVIQKRQVARLGQSNLSKAERAVKQGDLKTAEELYLQHVQVFPEDLDAKLKYAEVLLENSKTPARLAQVQRIYTEILNREPGRQDVRRLLAEAQATMGVEAVAREARSNLSVLLDAKPDDGALEYLMGRCQETLKEDAAAVASYKSALAHGAPEKFDAYQRMATLLRGTLDQADQADQAIEEMVKSDPENYRAYFERGRYRHRFQKSPEDLKKVEADYQAALKLAPKQAEIYLALAGVASQRTPPDMAEATRILKAGRDADPKAVSLYVPLANIELSAGKPDDAEKTLRQGIELLPDSVDLRIGLAEILAQRGATTELREQIEQLERIGMSFHASYFTAYFYVNAHEWQNAKKILTEKLQPMDLSSSPVYRAKISDLLAMCYAHLGDPERQRTALASSLRDNPQNLLTKLRWIDDLVAQGDVDQAISEYRAMVAAAPQVRLPLVQLLTAQKQKLPEAQRDWKEVENLIALAAKDAPSAPQPLVAKAQVLMVQGKASEAQAVLEEARGRVDKNPAAVVVWTALAEIQLLQRNYPAALKILDDAQAKLGDSFELRIERAKVVAVRGGPDADAGLVALTENLTALPAEHRVRLLDTVASVLAGRNAAAAARLWTEAAAMAPNDFALRQKLLSFGIQTDDKAVIEQALADIRRIEGPDGNNARHGDIKYKIWQAKNSKDQAEKSRLRAEARTMLAELTSRRPDWSVIPLANAQLDEMELELATDDEDKKRRQSRLADLYRQAIDMGQQNLVVVRLATEMLMASGRSAEVNQLWNKVPSLSSSGDLSGLERAMLGNVNQNSALELVRQRVEARPNDFSERVLLAQLLIKEKRIDEAEAELRKAVALDRTDSNRWIALVQFLVLRSQMDAAEKVAKEVEKAVAPDRAASTMAQCAVQIGLGYQAAAREPQKAKWFAEAKSWYQKAQAAKPGDFALKRATIEFLLQTNQLVDVENQLTDILKRPADFRAADLDWARRTLALSFVARSELSNDYPQALKALAIFAPSGQADSERSEAPEDLRVRARVYESQKIPAFRKKAVEVLEKLNSERLANDEDRFLLARLYNANDEWEKARSEYKQLMEESARPDSPQKLNRRVAYLVQYATDLIAHVKPGGAQDSLDAQDLIDQLKKIRPDAFTVRSLQARLDKAQGKEDAAVATLKEIADVPGLPPALALATAALAEDLGQIDMAQRLFKLTATASSRLQDRLAYAAFLGRQGRIKEALDVCEPLWTSTPNPEPLVATVIEALFPAKAEPDAAQIERVSQWIDRSIKQNPKSALFLIALGNIRERQKRYPDAEALYRQVIAQGSGDVIPLNNLAWLMALKGDKGAVPLDLINKAIALRGPIPEFLDTRAIVYLTHGESKRAIEDLENAVAIAPSATKYFHLAQAYLEASNKEAAKENLAKARTKGLAKGTLHPLELTVYEQVVSALD